MKPAARVVAALWCVGAMAADDARLAQCATVQDAAARLACYDAIPSSPEAPAPSPAEPVPAAPASDFGLPKSDESATLEARVVGVVTGWKRGTRFRLDNGQVWQVVDDRNMDYLDLDSPKVSIRKTLLGGYRMSFEGLKREAKVKRVS